MSTPEFDTVRFTMMNLALEWDGETKTLTAPDGTPDAVLDVIYPVFEDCSGTHVPAVVTVQRAANRLAQPVTDLRVVGPGGEEIPDDAQG